MEHPSAGLERLVHILDSIEWIERYCEHVSQEEFIADEVLHNGVLYQFIIIGEEVQRLRPDIQKRYPYPWHLPKSFRNYIAHEYFGVNLRQVYRTIREVLPEFKILVQRILAESKD